ncbi:MAG: hypothetical protein KKD12_07920, partial [Proteobacteria bacterium]|nr:hypothetical protein [Pseudomonadota bacterium]
KDNNPSEDIRQRYIANIVSGIDRNHLLEKDITPLTTNALNTPVSLIDYTENVSSAGSCSLFFFKFPESSSFCNLMGSMPFISMFSSTKPATNYTIDTIQADTGFRIFQILLIQTCRLKMQDQCAAACVLTTGSC